MKCPRCIQPAHWGRASRICIEKIRERVELVLPMRCAVARLQPVNFGPIVLPGTEQMLSENLRLVECAAIRHCYERLGDALVQALPPRCQQGLTRDVSEHRMPKPVALPGIGDEQPGI